MKMARYHWDANRIREKIKIVDHYLELLTDLPPNKENQEEIHSLIYAKKFYHDLLCCYDASKEETLSESLDYSSLEELVGIKEKDPTERLKSFLLTPYKIPKKLISISTNSLRVIEDYTIVDQGTPRYILNNEELLDVFHDFIRRMGTTALYQKMEKQKSHIELNIQKLPSYSYVLGGYCGFDKVFDDRYINLFRDNTIDDVVTLCHEFFHAFYYNPNLDDDFRNQVYYISELEGSFANCLVAEYYRQLGQERIANYIHTNYLMDFVIRNFELNIGFLLTRQKGRITLEKFNRKLDKKNVLFDFNDVNEVFDYLDHPAYLLLEYSLSYLASLDLFELYLEDREHAFNQLEKIRMVSGSHNLIRLARENGFTFMEKDYPSLQKQLKRIDK